MSELLVATERWCPCLQNASVVRFVRCLMLLTVRFVRKIGGALYCLLIHRQQRRGSLFGTQTACQELFV